MQTRIFWTAACALLLMGAKPVQGQKQPSLVRKANDATQLATANLTQLLDTLLSGNKKMDDARIEVQRYGDAGGRSVTIYGNGVGILNGDTPFRLTKNQTLDVLRAFQKVKFGRMPEHFGHANIPPGSERPLRIAGSAGLTIGSMHKEVTQIAEGEQSPEFLSLTTSVLKISADAARNSTPVANFADGLRLLMQKNLPPEALHLLVHHLIEEPDKAQPGDEGFLLRVEGRVAETRTHTKDKGYGTSMRLELKPEKLEQIVRLLADNSEADLPINLYAPHYTDFVVQILKHEKNVQARQFDGMTPQTHGEKQKNYDVLFAAMVKLHQLVLKEGKPMPQPQ